TVIDAARRKDRALAIEQCADLLLRATHGCRGANDLGNPALSVDLALAQEIDRRLVQAYHGAQRARDEVQLILNDEFGWTQASGEHPRGLGGVVHPAVGATVVQVRG